MSSYNVGILGFAFKLQNNAPIKLRSYHEQRGNILRAYVGRKRNHAAAHVSSANLQRRKAFVSHVVYFRTQTAQGFNQNAYGALQHARRTGNYALCGGKAEICGEKTHGSARSVNIHRLFHIFFIVQGFKHYRRVVALCEIAHTSGRTAESVYYQNTI